MKDKYFCDSNIFLYAFSNQDIEKQKIASNLILDKKCIISVQVINEVSNILIKKLNFTNNQIKKLILSCYERYKVTTFTKKTLLVALNIREKFHISYYDSLILASAINANCSILYTEDMQNGLKIDFLTIINPFKG